jgi:haloalkane dehalogenase
MRNADWPILAICLIGSPLRRSRCDDHSVLRAWIPSVGKTSGFRLCGDYRPKWKNCNRRVAERGGKAVAFGDGVPLTSGVQITEAMAMTNTDWVDRAEYPFQSRQFAGTRGRLHYVDEGRGDPVVLVHGTPTWSFLYRDLIKGLSKTHRCIAADNLGFGLSDKPMPPLRPQEQAQQLQELLDSLGLADITLVVHDFGGPIGLAYALARPEKVKRLVLFNTWMWPVKGDPHFERPARMLGGGFGRFLYERCNFAINVMMKHIAKSRISAVAYEHYRKALPTPADRTALWVFARELIGSSDWYASLFQQRDKISGKPALILWGLKDQAFPKKILQNWSLFFANAEIRSFEDAGHFVTEDKGAELVPIIEKFISTTDGNG